MSSLENIQKAGQKFIKALNDNKKFVTASLCQAILENYSRSFGRKYYYVRLIINNIGSEKICFKQAVEFAKTLFPNCIVYYHLSRDPAYLKEMIILSRIKKTGFSNRLMGFFFILNAIYSTIDALVIRTIYSLIYREYYENIRKSQIDSK